MSTEAQVITLHGHSIAYVQKGSGPVLLLIHGMAGSLATWRSVIDPLARNATVLAVDLPGHGGSSPGGGDYSLGSLAAGLRDVLTALGHDRATLVGHSLGGGIAMQFAYQFPEMTERLVLVSSGGLGLEVNPALRAASLPGANLFLSVTAEATRLASGIAGRVLRATHSPPRPGLDELVRSYASLADADRRSAFLATVRSVVGLNGQTVRAGDRLYLAEDLPVLLIWGAEDPIIPVEHATSRARAHASQHPCGVRRRPPFPPRRGTTTVRHGAGGLLRQHRAGGLRRRDVASAAAGHRPARLSVTNPPGPKSRGRSDSDDGARHGSGPRLCGIDLPGDRLRLLLRRVGRLMEVGCRRSVRAINRPLKRLRERRCLAGLDALKHDLIALDDLVDVDS